MQKHFPEACETICFLSSATRAQKAACSCREQFVPTEKEDSNIERKMKMRKLFSIPFQWAESSAFELKFPFRLQIFYISILFNLFIQLRSETNKFLSYQKYVLQWETALCCGWKSYFMNLLLSERNLLERLASTKSSLISRMSSLMICERPLTLADWNDGVMSWTA